MSSTRQITHDRIMVLGSTGTFGARIVSELLHHNKNPEVSCLVRDINNARNHFKDHVRVKSIESVNFIEGDVCKPETLEGKFNNIDIIISALQGDDHVILEGQKNVVEEAIKCKSVRRFIPSDYSIDFFSIRRGFHPKLDQRVKFASFLDEKLSGKTHHLEFFHPLNGVFMEVFWSDTLGIYDKKNSTLNYYGDGNCKIDVTSMRDVARYVIEGALDPNLVNDLKKARNLKHLEFEVKGDTVTLNDVAKYYEEIKGTKLKLNCLGSFKDLENEIQKRVQNDPKDYMSYICLMYQLALSKCEGQLRCPINNRYTHLKPCTMYEFMQEHDVDQDLLHEPCD